MYINLTHKGKVIIIKDFETLHQLTQELDQKNEYYTLEFVKGEHK